MINKQKQTMKVWKFFWAWQDNDEAAWLQQMSSQGWHLERTDLLRYTFRKGEPTDCAYGIAWGSTGKNDETEFLSLYEDAGWELIDRMSSYYYFRNTNPEQTTIKDSGEANAIFSNNESRMRHYRRILTFVAVISTPVFIMLLNGTLQAGLSRPGFFGSFYKVFTVIIGLYLILFIFGTIKLIGTISRRKRSLKE
jgi:hypothetical protein